MVSKCFEVWHFVRGIFVSLLLRAVSIPVAARVMKSRVSALYFSSIYIVTAFSVRIDAKIMRRCLQINYRYLLSSVFQICLRTAIFISAHHFPLGSRQEYFRHSHYVRHLAPGSGEKRF